jgi:predicted ester cyclase/catechol 2,3-dioxygenase-like lactoylglutathione lyase family enzyme
VIQHVALETRRRDGPEAEAFWRLLGFEPVDPPPTLRERAAWLQRGTTHVHLLWSDEPTAPPEGHTAVVLDDYRGTLNRLRDAGHAVEPRKEHWGAPRAYVRAPGGHRVEVMESPPPPNLEDRAREAIERVCSGGLDRAERFYDVDRFVDHVNEMEFHGREGLRQSVGLYLAIFDELRFEVEDQVTQGDRVASRWAMHGTHKGRSVTLRGITISRFEDGRIVEDWGFSDTTSLVRQLGLRRSAALGARWLTGRLPRPG